MDRTDPGLASNEKTMMLEFLDYHRATFVQKVTGMTSAELNRTAVPTSALTLGGLLKHLAHVEDSWLTQRFTGKHRAKLRWSGCCSSTWIVSSRS